MLNIMYNDNSFQSLLFSLLQGFNSEADEVEYVLSIMDQLTQELIDEGI